MNERDMKDLETLCKEKNITLTLRSNSHISLAHTVTVDDKAVKHQAHWYPDSKRKTLWLPLREQKHYRVYTPQAAVDKFMASIQGDI